MSVIRCPLSVVLLSCVLACNGKGNNLTPESTTVWLSGDRLVIGRWLIIPGEAVVELPGELAR